MEVMHQSSFFLLGESSQPLFLESGPWIICKHLKQILQIRDVVNDLRTSGLISCQLPGRLKDY